MSKTSNHAKLECLKAWTESRKFKAKKKPDEILAKIAYYDWEALERLCIALTLDIHLMKEFNKKQDTSYIV